MRDRFAFGRYGPVALLLAAFFLCLHASPARAAQIDESRVEKAVEKSLRLLQSSPPVFFKKAGCVSCHHQSLPAMTVGFARGRGFDFDEQKARELNETVATMMRARREDLLQAITDGAAHHSVAYTLAGMAAQGLPADAVTDAMAIYLAEGQLDAGYWSTAPDRPPAQYSDYTTTALSIWGMSAYTPDGWNDEFEMRIRRAKNWLLEATPTPAIEERAFRLLGLGWAGAKSPEINRAIRDLFAAQREDGGWAQLPTLDSDAYATGQALAALHLGGGMPISHPMYQQGVAFLLDTQHEDGSWLVKSRSRPFQPYFESGFPHAENQWISICATSWATIALMLTREPLAQRNETETLE
ncbi:MAG: terpene cyclase/mutase family protein [Acidobacteria bacterium]|nr:terpene cyclase/mutase family protein [Acidobacteriota bacterium]